jgi:pyruvate,water dikinase
VVDSATSAAVWVSLRDLIAEERRHWCYEARRLTGVNGGSEFLKELQVLLDANGGKAAGEFELAVPRRREDPSFVPEALRKLLEATQAAPLPDALTVRRQHRQETVQAALRPVQRRVFTRLLTFYSRHATMQKNARYRLMESYALRRRVFLDIGTNLATGGILDDASDVFFLTLEEALDMAAGDGDAQQKRALNQAREQLHTRQESLNVPNLVVDGGQQAIDSQAEGLTGIASSPDTAERSARVLYDTSEADSLRPGEIVVAPHTYPGWKPLFLSFPAAATDSTGFLSYRATVARESGVPETVNVKEATKRIQTGDLIRVDGASGRITVSRQVIDL